MFLKGFCYDSSLGVAIGEEHDDEDEEDDDGEGEGKTPLANKGISLPALPALPGATLTFAVEAFEAFVAILEPVGDVVGVAADELLHAYSICNDFAFQQ